MKTKSSVFNSLASIIQYVILMLVGFIAQKLFINILDIEYLGINGLFTNIISMLSIIELGVGSAIIYNLYKPFVSKDYDTINSLMRFYKNAYKLIAVVILLIGLCIMPFLGFFINVVSIDINIYFIYFLFILDIFFSYLLSY